MHDFRDKYSAHFCLSSNNSKDNHPDNTSTHFINDLSSPFINDSGHVFEIRIMSVAISARFDAQVNDHQTAGYLKIQIEELEQQRKGQKYIHFGGGFPYPPTNTLDYHYALHEFPNPPAIALRFQHLARFRVKIVDENDVEPALYPNFPTIIWIEMNEFSTEERGQFTITCDSYHPTLYPDNTVNKFNSPIPTELHLPSYEVALLNVYYPPQMTEDIIPIDLLIEEEHMRFNPNTFLDTNDFITSVDEEIRNTRFGGDYRFISVALAPNELPRLCLLRNDQPAWLGQQRVTMNVSFLRACGELVIRRRTVIMSPGDILTFDGVPNISNVQPTPVSMLYCDIIKPNIMGTGVSNLLQCVPTYLFKNFTETRLYEPRRLTFQSVVDYPFDRIKLTFLHPDGRARELRTADPLDSLIVTLLFRKRQLKL